MGEVTSCGLCGSDQIHLLLDLGYQPLAEAMGSHGAVYPLQIAECGQCTLVQLTYIPDQEAIFRSDHPYATGNTQVLREHFRTLALGWLPTLHKNDLVVDIGANDGTLLEGFMRRGVRPLGVEPTGQVRKMKEGKGIPAVQAFFTSELAAKIVADHGHAALVFATNVLAHVPDPHDFMAGVRLLLGADGVFVTENHNWASIVNGLQIDTIYHEHLRYYSDASLGLLLARHGLLTLSSVPVPIHGGSFRVTAIPQSPKFGERAVTVGAELGKLVRTCALEGPVYGIGAATRATPLIHFAGLAPYLACVCEVTGSEKIGSTMPGTGVPVVDDKKLIEDQPPYALLFSWHIASHLIPKLRNAGYRGKFILPLPEPRIADE
jgi:hypothetical protein